MSSDYSRVVAIIFALVFGISIICYLLRRFLQDKLRSKNYPPFSAIVIVLGSTFYVFVFYFGNRQFGGFDYSIMIDSGWRLATGQRPYIDFLCALPPGFMLGTKYAFLLLGPSWNSLVHLQALFTFVTFFWLFFLLQGVLQDRWMALLTAIWIEGTTNLFTSFWWYNSAASVMGGLFFLSALLFLSKPGLIWAQASFASSLFLLAMMKPNTALPLMIGAPLILITSKRHALKTIVLCAVSLSLVYLFLAVNHFPVNLVVQSYAVGGRSRGITDALAIQFYLFGGRFLLVDTLATAGLLIPFFLWWDSVKVFLAKHRIPALRMAFMLGLGPVVGAMAMLTNGDFKLVDMVLFIIAGVAILFCRTEAGFVRPQQIVMWRAFYVALCFSVATTGIYMGANRFRVRSTGAFYEVLANQPSQNPFFSDLRTGPELLGVLRDMKTVLKSGAGGPIFLGPRMEFAYAAFGLPSPKNLPIWWDPGTAFPLNESPAVLAEWANHRFGTLIFFKSDFTYYNSEFLLLLNRRYTRNHSFSNITVLNLKPDPIALK